MYEDDEYGFWHVTGECSNSEGPGPYIYPLVGFYKGFYKDVVKAAHSHPKFFTYGRGGRIRKIEFEEVSPQPATTTVRA